MLPGVQNKTEKVLQLIFSYLYVSLMVKVKHYKTLFNDSSNVSIATFAAFKAGITELS